MLKIWSNKGFTLFEVCLVLSLVAVVIYLTVALSQVVLLNNPIKLASTQIQDIIQYAKLEAMLRQQPLKLLPIEQDDWSKGLQLCSNNDLLYKWEFAYSGIKIVWYGFQSKKFLLIDSDPRHSAINGYFLIKNSHLQNKVYINKIGRTRIVTGGNE